jgi:peptidoglycan LD-endopeptidase LytH
MKTSSYGAVAPRPTFHSVLAAILVLITALLVSSCDRGVVSEAERPDSHEQFARQLEATGLSKTAMGQQWLQSSQQALREPLDIVLPFAESGGFLAHRAGALGLIFEAFDGQTLNLHFELRRDPKGQVFVELFYVREPLSDARHVRIRGLSPEESSMAVKLPYDGRYLVRLQPELLTDALYHLRMELDAAIPFPVEVAPDTVGSFFGDPRDAGSRLHEGIDIFAPRHTPVVAVASGVASARTTPRGGNVVWLRASGRSYYYAHLEKSAITGSRTVEAGEVLGYVGNSGNAITTPTHLHFGVYRRGHGAIDPLPQLAARIFESSLQPVQFDPRYVRTQASKLNLRAQPAMTANVLEQLDAGSILRTVARRGEWLRVATPGNVAGWIHNAYQEEVSDLGSWTTGNPTILLDSIGAGARPVALVGSGEKLDVIGQHATHLLLRTPDGRSAGWMTGPLPTIEDADIVLASDDDKPGQAQIGGGGSSGG